MEYGTDDMASTILSTNQAISVFPENIVCMLSQGLKGSCEGTADLSLPFVFTLTAVVNWRTGCALKGIRLAA